MTQINLLKTRFVTSAPPGRHSDGNGLFLVVSESGARNWTVVFTINGQRREMGLGDARVVSLAAARAAALEAKNKAAQGIDPIAERQQKEAIAAIERETAPDHSFHTAAMMKIASREPTWVNSKTRPSWDNSVFKWAKPLHKLDVADITTEHVLAVLRPKWFTAPVMAMQTQQRIEWTLDFATALGWRSGPNPARWDGHLDQLLTDDHEPVSYASLDYAEAQAFISSLHQFTGYGAKCMELIVYTVVRTHQALEAKWKEFNLNADQPTWTIPLHHCKTRKNMARMKEHRHGFVITLPAQVVELMRRIAKCQFGEQEPNPEAYVFPGLTGGCLSTGAMPGVLKRMGLRGKITMHGFRSTQREWSGDQIITSTTGRKFRAYSDEGCEAVLQHVVGSRTVKSYRRSDASAERAIILADWADFLTGTLAPAICADTPTTPYERQQAGRSDPGEARAGNHL